MTYSGKSVLVTGAGGSIGSELCDRAALDGARRLTMVSLTEGGLYAINRRMRAKYGDRVELIPVLGSVGDDCLMESALRGVDIVVHAGAHKHVPLCEQNPTEAIFNNVFGTLTLAEIAQSMGVESFCFVSSDKAVEPASIMGATKRLGELIVASLGFLAVRFGNVLDSAGSVLPLWREQILTGGPLTLTDARCERYFMSIPDAVGLISSAIELRDPGIFVLDMGAPRRLIDMARELMSELGRTVSIEFTGLRPGEKLTEELYHGGKLVPTGVPRVSRVDGDRRASPSAHELRRLLRACRSCDRERAVSLLWEMAR